MPRKKQDGQATPGKSNAFDPKHVRNAVERIENLKVDLATIMAGALHDCRAVHQDIKRVYQEAKDEHGIPKKALKSVIKARELERKAQAVREDLESDVQDEHDMLRHALGDLADLPLGQAALGDDVRPAFLREKTEQSTGL